MHAQGQRHELSRLKIVYLLCTFNVLSWRLCIQYLRELNTKKEMEASVRSEILVYFKENGVPVYSLETS